MDTSRSLTGKTVVITRARGQADDFIRLLADRGATVIEFPVIEIVPPVSWAEVDKALDEIQSFHWVIFTSVNAAKFFMKRFYDLGKDVRLLSKVRVCAVGTRTAAALEAFGLQADLIPSEFKAEGVLAALGNEEIKGRRILIPRAKEAREIIPEKLKEQGAEVSVVTVYENVRPVLGPEQIKNLLTRKKIDVVTFTSSSTVRNFVEMLGQKGYKALIQQGVSIACIGPVTAETAREYGMQVDILPEEYTISALVDAMAEYFKS